jgi:excisionase family DNA binding protein
VPYPAAAGDVRCDHESGDRMPSEPPEIHLAQVQFLTVAEVAAMMRVSKMTVYRLVHGGDLPAARVGRSFRVPKRAVEEYLRTAYFDAG